MYNQKNPDFILFFFSKYSAIYSSCLFCLQGKCLNNISCFDLAHWKHTLTKKQNKTKHSHESFIYSPIDPHSYLNVPLGNQKSHFNRAKAQSLRNQLFWYGLTFVGSYLLSHYLILFFIFLKYDCNHLITFKPHAVAYCAGVFCVAYQPFGLKCWISAL